MFLSFLYLGGSFCMAMILVYVSKQSQRCKYIFNLIFSGLVGINVRLTTSKEEFAGFEGPKINYSGELFEDAIFFEPAPLLFESGIRNQNVKLVEYKNIPCLFPVFDKHSSLPFDPFAAAFYMVSRYEEYFPFIKDKYDRYVASQSIASQKHFLQKPVVNYWAEMVKEIVNNYYPALKFRQKKYQFIPTIDIDAAYAFRLKGFVRNSGGFLKSLADRNFSEFFQRARVLSGLEKDPFDTYDYQFTLQKKYNLKPVYFILFADYGYNDKNISVGNIKFQYLLKTIADYAPVGIHPSFGSNFHPEKLEQEVANLSAVLKCEITKSRQHFLMLNFPATYRNLINLDIADDYSMGYASQIGFRAGIADTFPFYDLDSDTATHLQIHPFAVMDGTLADYLQIHVDEALQKIKPLIDETKAVKGTFMSIWHNVSLSNQGKWKDWRNVYEEMIQYALP
ncbi:MAG: polysaccharide deacetylase family protein [Lentimicrobiaceae bacterium]|nr:polysaccharide deacetylase family protein [Lentimicrobiaceae bacterium]